ncbi:MAG: ATP-binding cassette domain-containing protein, partial [Acidimicrobiaceae bacterium]|nr:ATP-binding cassette domain-containing protein [Acidimicrobiaceae bacterium]
LPIIPGVVPRPGSVAAGCRFRSRCAYAIDACAEDPMALVPTPHGAVRCVRTDDLRLAPAPAPAGGAALRGSRPTPLLEVRGLRKSFPVSAGVLRRARGHVRAVDTVDLTVGVGETLGLVGESGSGKSTIARLVLRLIEPTAGTVNVDGTDVTGLKGARLRQAREHMQMVFQDPYSSLDPRATIGASIGEPLEIHRGLRGAARDARVTELLAMVGIGPHLIRRYPHEFSGGQRQRIAIARALALEPRLLVCDEPVSALDTSTQSQVINLFADLQERLGLAYLFIAHDLSVVRHLSHRIAVMYLGRIVEEGPAQEVSERPTHPYTEALLSAIPVPDPERQRQRRRIVLRGEVPSALDPPTGCRFRTRCPYAMDVCAREDPPPFTNAAGTTTWCHLHRDGPAINGASVTTLGNRQA